jgi:hypothetical protein
MNDCVWPCGVGRALDGGPGSLGAPVGGVITCRAHVKGCGWEPAARNRETKGAYFTLQGIARLPQERGHAHRTNQ